MNWTSLREQLLGESDRDTPPPKLSIPALPEIVVEFCRAADKPFVTTAELAGIIDRDAALVLELLKVVNSASSGVRHQVNSTRMALNLLGVRRAKMFVLTSSVQTVAQRVKSPFASVKRFSFAAMQRAIVARRLADRLGFDADLAFAGALLQDFTIPALTAERPEEYRTLLNALTEDAPSLAAQEMKSFGWDHALAAARLMYSWRFPDDLVCLTLAHHWLEPILANSKFKQTELVVVALCSLLPDPLDARPCRTAQLGHHLTTRYGIEVETFQKWVHQDLHYSGIPFDPTLAWMPVTRDGILKYLAAVPELQTVARP